jgi:hypothetical protein
MRGRPISALWNQTSSNYACGPTVIPSCHGNLFSKSFPPTPRPGFARSTALMRLSGLSTARCGHINAPFVAVLLARSGRADEARRYLRMAEGPPEAVRGWLRSTGLGPTRVDEANALAQSSRAAHKTLACGGHGGIRLGSRAIAGVDLVAVQQYLGPTDGQQRASRRGVRHAGTDLIGNL